MVRPLADRLLEDNTLIIALALTLRLNAIIANGSLLTALDASFPASQAARLGPLPHFGIRSRGRAVYRRPHISSTRW